MCKEGNELCLCVVCSGRLLLVEGWLYSAVTRAAREVRGCRNEEARSLQKELWSMRISVHAEDSVTCVH
jgi:hypothetical protein